MKIGKKERKRILAGIVAGLIIVAMLISIVLPFAYGAEMPIEMLLY